MQIRKPNNSTGVTKNVMPLNVIHPPTKPVITENVGNLMPCSVSVKRISTSTSSITTKRPNYNMRDRPTPKKVTHRTLGRKRPQVDYSLFEDDYEPASPP